MDPTYREKNRAIEMERYKWRAGACSQREEVFLSRPVAIAAISRWRISDDLSAS